MMPSKRRTLHLICNAHIDPVWLWEWPEGAAAAISTFRSAAELCRQNESFVFNHNEAILYEWVREYEPALFREIQRLVKAGKWHIMGGWYLQPDCNMPSGESFVRQILAGRAYFKKHFNATPTTAINFDPFGHTRGLVQILAKTGYDSYLFGRPDQNDCPLPADEFVWVGYDDSEVMAARFRDWYNSPLGKAREKIQRRLADDNDAECELLLWGVGNHGGGPSRLDVRNVDKLIKQTKCPQIRHSTPEAYFKQLKRNRDKLPKHNKDLNPWAVGCYSSQIRIKQKHRKLENEVYSLEKMACAAAVNGLVKYPFERIQEALRDLMT
ncbi:MAG: alpha-mannosidase, partial [Planctomycetes bacterium]|nr:alpha-mannosidase [Planctomycetota bacterium]